MNKIILVIFSIIVLSLANLQDASAAITVFTDKTIFLTTTSASSATGALPNLGKIAGGAAASQTVGTVTFTITPPSSELFIGAAGTGIPGNDWTVINPGPDIAISGIDNLNADLSAPVFALGFDFVEPSFGPPEIAGTGFVDSTFSVTLINGAVVVDSFQFNAPNDVLAFVGVSSDLAFNRVEIRDLTATDDDEFWGEFYTSTTAPPPPPPPPQPSHSHDIEFGDTILGPTAVVSSSTLVMTECPPGHVMTGFTAQGFSMRPKCNLLTVQDFVGVLFAVGGKFLQIDTISILLAYAIVNAVWMAPIGIGIGVGIYLVKRRF